MSSKEGRPPFNKTLCINGRAFVGNSPPSSGAWDNASVVRQAHQCSLRSHLLQTSQREATEAARLFDLPKDRFKYKKNKHPFSSSRNVLMGQ
jgi:hypothetical protein